MNISTSWQTRPGLRQPDAEGQRAVQPHRVAVVDLGENDVLRGVLQVLGQREVRPVDRRVGQQPPPARAERAREALVDLGFGRTVASAIEVPIVLASMV